ncbi:LysR family transcriptional regulator [Acidiphilium sp. AL]|uniref:LysR substrate-binding domain-containing protein n=1 Tax=Acidiphilium iwatense TaxID=768198 RepID=A0ABS9E1X5_9PROT|nr:MULTISPECIES: LysR substrate-binding domain-containing protein [Acidiphilium]MCF3947579.1 LysR substrate-binding domain-containing protein [Acidiphilium iwatense]MCU4160745.1 LysR family transcriptional regulator [Acidiphilium sp. AL]
MQLTPTLESDVLRAFVCVAEERSFTRAASRIGRTQSAVSMQIRKLEDVLGHRLLHRGRGEGVELTAHGVYLLGRAKEMLAINDQVWTTFRAPEISGEVRLGTPDDYALEFLPEILRRFADAHPAVQIAVHCAESEKLAPAVADGKLDLALLSEGFEPDHAAMTLLWRGKLAWATSALHDPHLCDPLPVALAHEGCTWRRAATRALESAGRRYRVAYTSATHVGTLVPVIAGLAVTVVVPTLMPAGVRLLRPGEFGLPPLPEYGILLMKGVSENTKTVDALAAFIVDGFRAEAARVEQKAA